MLSGLIESMSKNAKETSFELVNKIAMMNIIEKKLSNGKYINLDTDTIQLNEVSFVHHDGLQEPSEKQYNMMEAAMIKQELSQFIAAFLGYPDRIDVKLDITNYIKGYYLFTITITDNGLKARTI
jgi:hypothetical protein